MIRRLLPLALLATIAAPAHAQHAAPASRQDRNRISAEEVRRSTATDAYQLVQSLRSMWLARREARMATQSGPPPHRDVEGFGDNGTSRAVQTQPTDEQEGAGGLIVLLDSELLGGRDALREIPINRVAWVEFLTPQQAQMRYDRRARDGAIVVHTLGAGDR